MAARSVLSREHGCSDIGLELRYSDQVSPRASAEKKPLFHPGLRQLPRREQQSCDADSADHVNYFAGLARLRQIILCEESMPERPEQSHLIARLQPRHEFGASSHHLV